MNIHTFKDAVTARRQAISNDIDEDDEDDHGNVGKLVDEVDGEEADGAEKVDYKIFKM